jgi:cytochrome c oxidase subunit 2
MPTVITANAKASGVKTTNISVKAQSWDFDISEGTITVGKPVKFSGISTDTMHGFAVYHPNGKVLFTMMLMPGSSEPTSLIHTFTEPGTYTVRCLEYCGANHHEMRDEITVVANNG